MSLEVETLSLDPCEYVVCHQDDICENRRDNGSHMYYQHLCRVMCGMCSLIGRSQSFDAPCCKSDGLIDKMRLRHCRNMKIFQIVA